MHNFFTNFTISDWIQLFGILASLITSVIAIWISVKTLKQNSKMIEGSTRPVISIYSKYSDGVLYYIIKNFGTSTAHIDKVITNFNIPKADCNMVDGNPFESLSNSTLAPMDSKICPLVSHSLKSRKFNFEIYYHSSTNKYHENFFVDGDADNPFPDTHPSADNESKALKNISNTLHDIKKSKF